MKPTVALAPAAAGDDAAINEFRNRSAPPLPPFPDRHDEWSRLQIKVKGSQIPRPVPTFDEMAISPEIKPVLLRNIEASDWKEPTPIQMQAIPILLANRDLLASAPTGRSSLSSLSLPQASPHFLSLLQDLGKPPPL